MKYEAIRLNFDKFSSIYWFNRFVIDWNQAEMWQHCRFSSEFRQNPLHSVKFCGFYGCGFSLLTVVFQSGRIVEVFSSYDWKSVEFYHNHQTTQWNISSYNFFTVNGVVKLVRWRLTVEIVLKKNVESNRKWQRQQSICAGFSLMKMLKKSKMLNNRKC